MPDSSTETNVVPDQVYLVLTRGELQDVVDGLRQAGKPALAERLEQLLRRISR